MELRLTLFLVLCCVTLDTGWCMDQDVQSLVDRLESSIATNFTVTTSNNVHHIELDLYQPCDLDTPACNKVIYVDMYSLKTSDGTTSTIIAGDTTLSGYKEGIGSEARFSGIFGFTQISDERVIMTDISNSCLREIDRGTRATSQFSGQCRSKGYTDGHPGQLDSPWFVIRDTNDDMQLLVTDSFNSAVRTVNISSTAIGTFVQDSNLMGISEITQDDKGDLYVIKGSSLYHITYKEKTITLIIAMPHGYRDGSLLNSKFGDPRQLRYIGNQTLLVVDEYNDKIRLVDLNADLVSTLDLCSSCLDKPWSLIITNTSLYVGERRKIQQFIYQKPTTTPITTTTTETSTTALQITFRAPCPDSDMTYFVTSDEEKAFMDTGPDEQIGFAVGSHVIYRGNCTINIIVINNSTTMAGRMPRRSTPEPQSTEDGNLSITAGKSAQQPGISNLTVALISSAVGIIVVICVLVFAAYVIRLRTITNRRNESSAGIGMIVGGGQRPNRENQSSQENSQDERSTHLGMDTFNDDHIHNVPA